MATFVLVPGALFGAEHFSRLTQLLRGAGGRVEALAVEFPELADGDAAASPRALYEAHVAAVVAAIDGASKPVVLLGHSTAGSLVMAAAEIRSSLIDKLVFLAADTLPGAPAFSLDPAPAWATEGIFRASLGGLAISVADDMAHRASDVLFAGATDEQQAEATALLRLGPLFTEAASSHVPLDKVWDLPKAYIKCARDEVILPTHQDVMLARLRDGAMKFELDCGHAPFVSFAEGLAATLQEIAEMSSTQFRPSLRQLCEGSWADAEQPGDLRIELVDRGGASERAGAAAGPQEASAISTLAADEAPSPPPAKRPNVPPREGAGGAAQAFRISKSRRDSTLVKVLKFPDGVASGAPAWYWYESFVDDPAQYTNASLLNVPEKGHEPPLDMAGMSRSLCAEGVVTFCECNRVAFAWSKVVTKVPGAPWTATDDPEPQQVWGIDGREWNGSYTHNEAGCFVENLNKYSKGSVEAFWEDVPRKATDLLASMA